MTTTDLLDDLNFNHGGPEEGRLEGRRVGVWWETHYLEPDHLAYQHVSGAFIQSEPLALPSCLIRRPRALPGILELSVTSIIFSCAFVFLLLLFLF